MTVGIPRALLYYKNEKFWTTYFNEIGVDYIISPETNKEILTNGENLAIDEACLPSKLLLGHIDWLIGKCDYIFLPRVAYHRGYDMCTKFLAQIDLVANIFRDRNIKLLFYDVKDKKIYRERKAVGKMGKYLSVKRSQRKYAYIMAKQAQQYYEMFREQNQEKLLNESAKPKILLVAHAYNVGDKYVGGPVTEFIRSLGCEPIIAEYTDEMKCIRASHNVTANMPWAYNRHLVGAIELLKDKVDGIILLTTFPCGTDSMVNEFIVRTYKDKPIMTLTVDSQDGSAGMETRIESFVDIIQLKKEKQ
ncbi:MAG: acyl-CoA dehydratase activase-related protein [Roseburia sp.]|nr:acyl-CoA dehydratase activase-related protein [Roseburia sp.]